jgi:release factor glutamine methyltransferase
MPSASSGDYRPMMSPERARQLRRWHLDAYRQLRQDLPRRVLYMDLDLYVPRNVFPPAGSGSFHRLISEEVQPSDRVLDMGTGCGIDAILAARKSAQVVGVDLNPRAVEAAAVNAARNGVADRIQFMVSDVFQAVEGDFDLILFDPPFRWFAARDLLELSTADENYRALKTFMGEVRSRLRPGGRVLLHFGTTGDIDYLESLIKATGLKNQVLALDELATADLSVAYYVFRLTA